MTRPMRSSQKCVFINNPSIHSLPVSHLIMATSASAEAWTLSMTHASLGQQIQCDDPPCVLLCSSISFSDDVAYPYLWEGIPICHLPYHVWKHGHARPLHHSQWQSYTQPTLTVPATTVTKFLDVYWLLAQFLCTKNFGYCNNHTLAASSRSAKRLGLEQLRSRDESLSWSVWPIWGRRIPTMSITCAVQFTLAKTLPMVALLNTLKASGLARRCWIAAAGCQTKHGFNWGLDRAGSAGTMSTNSAPQTSGSWGSVRPSTWV